MHRLCLCLLESANTEREVKMESSDFLEEMYLMSYPKRISEDKFI